MREWVQALHWISHQIRETGHNSDRSHIPVLLKEAPPRLHDFVYFRSQPGVLVPASREEVPHLFNSRRNHWPGPQRYPDHDCRIAQSPERGLPGEDFDHQHCKGEDVGGFGLHYRISRTRLVDDFWCEPPGIPSGQPGRGKHDGRRNGVKAVIRQPYLTQVVNEDIRLRDGVSGLEQNRRSGPHQIALIRQLTPFRLPCGTPNECRYCNPFATWSNYRQGQTVCAIQQKDQIPDKDVTRWGWRPCT